jgi:hypothetical protein
MRPVTVEFVPFPSPFPNAIFCSLRPTFGECEVMAQPVARSWLVSPSLDKHLTWSKSMETMRGYTNAPSSRQLGATVCAGWRVSVYDGSMIDAKP